MPMINKVILSTKITGKKMTKSTTPSIKGILNENQKKKTGDWKDFGINRNNVMRGDSTAK